MHSVYYCEPQLIWVVSLRDVGVPPVNERQPTPLSGWRGGYLDFAVSPSLGDNLGLLSVLWASRYRP